MKVYNKNQLYYKVPLSDRVKEIILGSLLGDMSLKRQKGYRYARLQFRHSEKDKAYFFWKANQLKEIALSKAVSLSGPDGFSKKNGKYRFASKACEPLDTLYEYTHKNNKLRIRRRWLNKMTPLSLAVWWCDDGSLVGEGSRKGVICTDGFDEKSVKLLVKYLRKVWGVKAKASPVTRERKGVPTKYWRIWFSSTEELKKFLRIIIPYIPVKEMLRKVIMLYKDSQHQQRWISEIIKLSSFTKEEVMEAYEKKRKRYKKYSSGISDKDIVQSL